MQPSMALKFKFASRKFIRWRTVSQTVYAFLVLITIVATGLSCATLLSQAVRTAPRQSWKKNVNALVIAGSYLIVVNSTFIFFAAERNLMKRNV